ncbi:two-component system response regulator [Eionea flava]
MGTHSALDQRENAGILIIDDNMADGTLFSELIDSDAPYAQGDILHAHSCEEALVLLEKFRPVCCLVDYMLPGADGAEFIKSIRQQGHNKHIPIIMMTGEGNEKVAVEIMRSGAQDYLIKGEITEKLLNLSIKNAIQTCELQDQLHYLAHYDTLTGLINRSLFLDRLQTTVDKCDRYNNSCSVMYIDVDNFKYINDSFGHYVGDEVLSSIAKRMKESCRVTDSSARLGGDEFAILLDSITEDDAKKTAEKILHSVSKPIIVDGQSFNISVSIGLVFYPKAAKDMHELLKQADEAMYQAKQSGKAGYSYFSDDYRAKWERTKQLEIMLPVAIKNNELSLAYQPILNVSDCSLYGLEILARWRPEGFEVSAQEMVGMIERLDLFDPFHSWLMNAALSQCAQWEALGSDIQYCLNIPANHVHSEWLVHALHKALQAYSIDPFHISLEITETTLMDSAEPAAELLGLLQNEGVSISVEDFGAGKSSMAYLTSLPLDVIKIDHQFIQGLSVNPANRKVVEAITALGHSMNLQVVAEGVETQEDFDVLQTIGCDLVQGFYFSAPKTADDIWRTFSNGKGCVNQYSNLSQASCSNNASFNR